MGKCHKSHEATFHFVFHSFHRLMNSINWPAPHVWVFIAQLVEHCSANAEATDSNPVKAPKKKNALFLSVNVFSTKVLIGDTIFTSPTGDGTAISTWSSEPREGAAVSTAKAVTSFLSYFKTLSIGPAPGIEPATSRSPLKRSTD